MSRATRIKDFAIGAAVALVGALLLERHPLVSKSMRGREAA